MSLFGNKSNRKADPPPREEDRPKAEPAKAAPPWKPSTPAATPAPAEKSEPFGASTGTATESHSTMERKGVITIIGQEITIKGELLGDGDVTLEGRVEGKIILKKNLVVGEKGHVEADIHAATVTISGKVFGNVFSENKVEIVATGFLEGNIHAPKIVIAEGAHFKGSVDMSSVSKTPDGRPAAPPAAPKLAGADKSGADKSGAKTPQGQLKPLGEQK
jgi:cytoskeletal protein CcmA (bactofilin family)